MHKNQRTIKKSISCDGVGLHTGFESTVTFHPAEENYGIRFVRTDLPNSPEILAEIDHVVDISRGTTIAENDVKIHTVEHVLAAVVGLEIDNIKIELSAPEPPVCDGSSEEFVKTLLEVGIVEQESPRKVFVVDEAITFHDPERNTDIHLLPSDRFRVTCMIDFKNQSLGTQYASLYSLQEDFVEKFAPARTFCFLSEVEMLKEQELIKGGTLDNALVFVDKELDEPEQAKLKHLFGLSQDVFRGANGMLNGKNLRFEDEPVRHKVLDLIGDLALLGMPIQGHVIAARSGHAPNVEFVKKIREKLRARRPKPTIKIEEILEILPHRYPFVLVDRIVDMPTEKSIVGIKNVTINEPFFIGHFPEHPVMPGVLIVEAMGQVGGILLLNVVEKPEEKLVYFTGFENVKFRRPVVPGDQLRLEVELVHQRRAMVTMEAKVFVDENLVSQATLKAAIVDK